MRSRPFTTGCLLLLAPALSAQAAASYRLFGGGCNGAPVTHCLALNDQNPALAVLTAPNEYAYPFVNSSGAAIQVTGFDAFTVANSGAAQTVGSGLCFDAIAGAATPSQPAVATEASGRLTATQVASWCTTALLPPVVVPAGAVFWLQLESYGLVAPPQHSSGSPGIAAPWYRRPNIGFVWTQSVSVTAPMLRVHCLPVTPAVPTLTASLVPQIGLTFGLSITGGQPFGLAALAWGYDTVTWRGLPLPLDLAVVGAPGCFNHTSADITSFLGLDALGANTVIVALPNVPAFIGLTFFNQAVMLRPGVNALGMLLSNAGAGVVGP